MIFYRIYMKNDVGILRGAEDKDTPAKHMELWFNPESRLVIEMDHQTKDRRFYSIGALPYDPSFVGQFFPKITSKSLDQIMGIRKKREI